MKNKYKALIVVVFLLPLLVYDVIKYFTLPDIPADTIGKVEIVIPKGASLQAVADTLAKKGLIKNAPVFVFWARGLGIETRIPSGRFKIPMGLTYPQLANYLTRVKPEFRSVTLIEGWPTEKILAELSSALNLNRKILDSLTRDTTLLKEYGIPAKNVTGYLLPDTYVFAEGVSEEQVIRFLIEQTLKIFEADSVKQKMREMGFNRHQVVTLASIVEGEAMIDEERPIIASVYLNRLKRGMRLQADPTIQFIITDGPRRLTYKDLKIDSPYNTYRYAGLPPGPINNPGKKSILATVFAAKTKYLYFVARGDGSHVFTVTAREHLKAKQKLNKIRKKIYGF
ncbi:aminodeoxychorismate lyase [Caldithrix abyssi DSM 13497]|uniref:Endolytic murein transglycosylase n=1 Tax=Caldithrix abyssi DSM 13497 TaxID=880073 RepID=H1XWY9_CALAY|nr:endolytic transglycosylase MltG [Caldithrix abyssi]APF19543.1 UPF0755 protein [Caldithrix abyssi DSM 13497]EHO39676.1 aminodeoxychorismate lyase [Caldithrix abyssi DSM 13497]